MNDEAEPQHQPLVANAPDRLGRIFDLIEEERDLLREFAARLRDHSVRNPVAREALDRAADELERAAALHPELNAAGHTGLRDPGARRG